MSINTNLNHKELPITLYEASPATKLLYLYLKPLGYVDYSSRQLRDTLGLAQPTILKGLKELTEIGLLEFLSPKRPKRKSTFRIKG